MMHPHAHSGKFADRIHQRGAMEDRINEFFETDFDPSQPRSGQAATVQRIATRWSTSRTSSGRSIERQEMAEYHRQVKKICQETDRSSSRATAPARVTVSGSPPQLDITRVRAGLT